MAIKKSETFPCEKATSPFLPFERCRLVNKVLYGYSYQNISILVHTIRRLFLFGFRWVGKTFTQTTFTEEKSAYVEEPKGCPRYVSHIRRLHMHRSRFAVAVLLSMVVLVVPCAWAQENATIVGTVVDASNAVVPNAEITLTNTATSQTRTATSNTSGIYLFANVGVGQFTL